MELVKATFATAIHHGRHRFWFLLTTAVIVFVPLGLIEVFNEGIDIDTEEGFQPLQVTEALAIAVTALLGEIFYAGAIATVVARDFEPNAGYLLRTIPWLTILALDIIVAFAVAFGLIFLVLPGLWIYGCWVLAATVAEIEHLKIRPALRRSAELTKGHRVKVVTVLLGVMIASELLSEALQHLIESFEADEFIAEWLSAAASGILVSPIFALLCAAFVIELRARREPSPAGEAVG